MDDMKRKAYATREDWLMAAVKLLSPRFKAEGYPLPAKLRVTVSFPWQGSRGKAIGQHFPVTMSGDGTHELLIHPKLTEWLVVLGTLTHELCHAAAPPDAMHGPKFAKIGRAMLLEGKPKNMGEGPEFEKQIAKPIMKELGAYPHGGFDHRGREAKTQGTRLLKCECDACGYIARVTAKWINEVGPPVCPADEAPMTVK